MKSEILATFMITAALLLGCSKNDDKQSMSDHGLPIDTTVVGKDTTSADTRRDNEQSEQKRTNPDETQTRIN